MPEVKRPTVTNRLLLASYRELAQIGEAAMVLLTENIRPYYQQLFADRADKQIYYWGDIDTHGFAILNQFRQHLPQTKSLLMDDETLMSHRQQWVKEQKPTQVDLPHLNEAEHKLYNRLRYNQIQQNLRLEQEYVSYSMLLSRLRVNS